MNDLRPTHRSRRAPRATAAAPRVAAAQHVERIAPFAAASFVKSVVDYAECPPDTGPEIAFVGRSNAGKSSSINRFVGQTRLAYASKLPGRTRELNFFALRGGGYLVDLPGYGFARTPRDKQRVWIGVIEAYLRQRAALKSVVIVSDIRHAPHEMDLEFIDWLNTLDDPARPRPRVLWLLNKADKLTQSERMKAENTLRKQAAAHLVAADRVVLFSANTGLGMKACAEFFGEIMSGTGVAVDASASASALAAQADAPNPPNAPIDSIEPIEPIAPNAPTTPSA